MMLDPIRDLAIGWRSESEVLRRRGAPGSAEVLNGCADELDERLDEWWLEELTIEEAAKETGLAYDTVQRKVASGEWPNVRRKGAPRVRRRDVLPGSPEPGPRLVTGEPDIAEEVLRARDP